MVMFSDRADISVMTMNKKAYDTLFGNGL